MADAVGREELDQRLVVLDRLFVVVRHQQVVAAEGPVALALGHPVEVLERLLIARLGLGLVPQVAVHHAHPRVGTAELGVVLDRLS